MPIGRRGALTCSSPRQPSMESPRQACNRPKAEAAAVKMRQINSGVTVEPVVADINRTNIEDLCRDADLILDGSDNFEVRYLINDVAVKLGKPWVYGGAVGSQGMSMTVVPGETPCLRCVFAEGDPAWAPLGFPVIGAVAGTVGCLAAMEVIKLVADFGVPSVSRLLHLDLEDMTFRSLRAVRDPRCADCGRPVDRITAGAPGPALASAK